jgi:hypothetical protein
MFSQEETKLLQELVNFAIDNGGIDEWNEEKHILLQAISAKLAIAGFQENEQ